MIRTRYPALASLLLLLGASLHAPALIASTSPEDADRSNDRSTASSQEPDNSRHRRIRTTDARMRALIRQGVRASPSLRALVERLERSDVVVYVRCDGHGQSRVAGRLIFISAAGGLRYVAVRVARFESHARQIAILAHELQHAVEIADTPAIVDGPSLAREYQRFGHINHSSTKGIAFDTDAAVAMGQKVLGEVATMTGD